MAGTSDWVGFSEEDIRRMQSKSAIAGSHAKTMANERRNHSVIQGSKPIKLNAMPVTKCRILKSSEENRCGKNNTISKTDTVPDTLENSANVQECEQMTLKVISNDNASKDLKKPDCVEESSDESKNVLKEKISVPNYSTFPQVEENNEMEMKSFNSRSVLEAFEQRQKHMEFENARRKALISKAIHDRKKRTQSEAKKLIKIQEELNHLDGSLSLDVSILRNHIEQASLEFSEAEKRYLKAEKEFIEAKVMLFQKMERKERLTEHLCAIIEQNEDRKANRLSELMLQLEMETDLEEPQTNGIGIPPLLTNLSALNDVAYQNLVHNSTDKPPLEKKAAL